MDNELKRDVLELRRKALVYQHLLNDQKNFAIDSDKYKENQCEMESFALEFNILKDKILKLIQAAKEAESTVLSLIL